MKLKLKENPRDWQRYTTVIMVLFAALATLSWRRGFLPQPLWIALLFTLAAIALTAWLYAPPFRPVYRVGMTIGFHIGQVMGYLILTLFFLGVLSPLGLVLRLLGKDLLLLRRRPAMTTYWHPTRTSKSFDRLF